jgi:tyrosyl-tRNA synthetase
MVTEYVIPEIHGIKEALAELNSFDKVYRKQITKDIQRAGVKIISAARELIPSFSNSKGNGAPLSGMVRGSMIKGRDFRWSNEQVRDGFKIKVGQAKRKEGIVQFAGKDKVFFKGKPTI